MECLEVGEFTEEVFISAVQHGTQFDAEDIQVAVEVTLIALMLWD